MGAKMATLGPIIAQQRPDIWLELARLRWPLKEVYAEVTRVSKPISDGPISPKAKGEAKVSREEWIKSLGRSLKEKK